MRYLDVLQPVGGLQAGEPVGLLHVGIDDVLELLEGLAHHMDVVDVQEDQLRVLIGVVPLVAPTCRL